MNRLHRWYCNSERWSRELRGRWLPWALGETELGDNVLEIGPGPGLVTDWLRPRVARLTAIEIDQDLAKRLMARTHGTNVTVVEGDGTAMPFEDRTFSSVVSLTMLHHVPSAELQDRLLAEAWRVLRPGGTFTGADSIPNFIWNISHLFDTRVPVDPDAFRSRLEGAGFTDVDVDRGGIMFRFRAKR